MRPGPGSPGPVVAWARAVAPCGSATRGLRLERHEHRVAAESQARNWLQNTVQATGGCRDRRRGCRGPCLQGRRRLLPQRGPALPGLGADLGPPAILPSCGRISSRAGDSAQVCPRLASSTTVALGRDGQVSAGSCRQLAEQRPLPALSSPVSVHLSAVVTPPMKASQGSLGVTGHGVTKLFGH